MNKTFELIRYGQSPRMVHQQSVAGAKTRNKTNRDKKRNKNKHAKRERKEEMRRKKKSLGARRRQPVISVGCQSQAGTDSRRALRLLFRFKSNVRGYLFLLSAE